MGMLMYLLLWLLNQMHLLPGCLVKLHLLLFLLLWVLQLQLLLLRLWRVWGQLSYYWTRADWE